MSIYFTTPSRLTDASTRISEDIERYLSAGGEIQQIPTGHGAYNLQLREVESRGRSTAKAWVDDRLSMRSQAAKGLSVRKRIAKESEQAAAKKQRDRK